MKYFSKDNSERPHLQKTLSLWNLFTIAFGAIVGTSWTLLVGNWMVLGGGPLPSMYAFLLATIILVPIGSAFSELASAIPVAGGAAVHAFRAFGEKPAFLCGWFLLLSNALICPWEAIVISSLLSDQVAAFPAFAWLRSIKLYSVMHTDIYLWPVLISAGFCLWVIRSNLRGVQSEARLSAFLVKPLLLGMALTLSITLFAGSASNTLPTFVPVSTSALGSTSAQNLPEGVIAVLAIAPFYYAGFDTITIHAGEAARGINWSKFGKVISLAILAAGCFYLVSIYSFGTLMPWREFIQSPSPALSTLKQLNIFAYAIMIGVMIFGSLGPMNAFLGASSRIAYGLARHHQLPSCLMHRNDTGNVPDVACYILAGVTVAGPLLGHDILTPLATVASAGFIFSCVAASFSCLKLRFSEPDLARPYKVPGGMVGISIACINSLILLFFIVMPGVPSSLTASNWLVLLLWTCLGYTLHRHTHRGGFTEQSSEDAELVIDAEIRKR